MNDFDNFVTVLQPRSLSLGETGRKREALESQLESFILGAALMADKLHQRRAVGDDSGGVQEGEAGAADEVHWRREGEAAPVPLVLDTMAAKTQDLKK